MSGKRTAGMLVGAAAVVALAWAGALEAQAAPREPKVICITEFGDPGFGKYRDKPRECIFGERGEPAFGYTTTSTSKMRWKRWGNRRTVGHGRVGISTVGAERVRVILSKKRERCGRQVYTHARFIARIRYQGQSDRQSWSQPLDVCLS